MRPTKLTISAFGPFASKQVIDFDELKGRNIFVISGKTGAGKTTIFDAISYALYGEASGDSREADSLRSHFADDETETYVELEFEIKGEKYIVNRVPKQKKRKARGEGYTEKNADATLILPNGKVITKVKNVTDKIIEILGITREQFKQIVMLAQGEFKKLLLADSLDREEIFRKIFNTYDFKNIQDELKKKADGLNYSRSRCKEEIQINLKNITGEHDIVIDEYIDFMLVIEKLKVLIEEDDKLYDKINEELETIDKNLQLKNQEKERISNNNKRIKDRDNIKNNLDKLLLEEELYKNKEKDIINIKNAKDIVHIEDILMENKKKLFKKEEEGSISSNKIKNLEIEQENISKLYKDEEDKEPQREQLSLEINQLTKLEDKIIELDVINKNINNLNVKLKSGELQIDKNKNEIENLKNSKQEKESILKEITNLETKKVELESNINIVNQEVEESEKLLELIGIYQNLYKNHSNNAKEYLEFEAKYIDEKEKYEMMDNLYKKEQAGILAMNLNENQPCPVCGSTHHPNKATINKELKVSTLEELKIKKEELEKLEKENQEKINFLTNLETSRKNCLEQIKNHNIIVSKSLNVINLDESFDLGTIDIINNIYVDSQIKKNNFKEELTAIINKISLKEKIEKEISEIIKKIEEKEQELIQLNENKNNDNLELIKNKTKLDEYKKDIPEHIKNTDTLKSLIENKTKELNDSKVRLNDLRLKKEDISKQLEGEKSVSNEIAKIIEELKLDINNNQNSFNEALDKYKFESKEKYNEYKLQILKLETMEKEVENYNSEVKLNKSRYKDIINETKDIVFIDIKEIEEEINNKNSNKLKLENEARSLYSKITNNKTILKNIEKLNVEFKEIEEEYKIVGELSELANGRKAPYISFERYILASYFEDIIEAANIRLEKMTGDRFSLIRKTTKSKGAGQKGLELEIYDNYTDSSRDVSSLSGGESFKASLSLALGLSDIVQSNAGGVSLDTMFVDEGFGTLDPQSLDNAIDSLLELQRGGRLVGIISHVEELKERIDAKLEVTATTKGSIAQFNIL